MKRTKTISTTRRAAMMLLVMMLTTMTAGAQTYVSDAAGLEDAFDNTDVSVINVTDNITDVGDLEPLNGNRALTINLKGHTISGDGIHFYVGSGFLTINGEGQDGSVGNIISGNADLPAINNREGTVTLRNVNITTNYDHAIGGPGMLNIGENVSFNGWTERPFTTPSFNIIEDGNYNYDPGNPLANVVATVTVGDTPHYFENLGAALAYFANNPGNDGFSLLSDTYTIKTAADWGLFCDMLEAGETFSGKTVELADDITVTRMAGGQPFTGTFDGGGHTLTLDYGTADAPVDAQFVAPFVETASGTSPVFRNLTISGTIYDGYTGSEAHNVGGLIGHLFGTVTIEHCVSRVEIHAKVGAGGFVGLCEHSVSFTDCHSSAVVHSADGSNSGFVAWSRSSSWEINFTGCLFDGKLLQQNGTGASNGGFIGWKGDAKTVNITNCLCAPATLADGETMATDGSATFSREHSDHPATIKNSYYTQSLGAAQGKQARAVTAGTDVTVAHAGVATHYATSGITAYKATGASADSHPFIAGLLYNNNVVDVLYAGSDDVVSLTLSNTGAPDGYQYGYTTNAGTLSGTGNPYTLTMPAADVTVSVNTEVLVAIDWATVSTGADKDNAYMIYNKDQLDLLAHRVNGTHGETAVEDGYRGKYFKLGKDIKYTHKADGEEGADAENNYEAIGGYYNDDFRYFRGHFDGNNKTISGIRIYKGADYYQGIFGRTDGADIHHLTLTDARITGYNYTGGIVGYNIDGKVTGCHVTGDVAVCAVQSDAYDYGGIAGYNTDGTIEQCTSAATLTTADADNSWYYGGIAGINDHGTLRDNLAIGATVPAVADNSYGAITGDNVGGSLQRNYYTACKVADVENATGVGCEAADVNNDNNPNGAVSIHTLTLADGITTTTAATVTIGTTGYYAQGTAIALSYSGTIGDGYQLAIVSNDGNDSNAATADGSGNYTAVMPAANATATDHAPIDWATVSTGADKDNAYMIYNNDQLDLLAHRVNGTHGETRQTDGYENKFFQLAKDISYPHKADGEEGADTESNYEAIGGYYNDGNRYFCGNFDGNNKTISGIRIYKDGDGDADRYQGIFGRTDSGADIHHLTLADARITGYDYTGGIVGSNNGTVSGCHVADDVAVCAVQSDAWSYGGIVGYNSGTIEQCTSAATLTTADATQSMYYGGIAGYNRSRGTLSDNLAIGATVPAAKNNSYGAIVGNNYNGGTLQSNYYAACKVADTENATGVGCNNADVTANNGAVSIHTLTLADGITTSTPVTVTIGTTGYYAQGTAIALSYSGTIGDGYQLAIVSNDGNGSNAATADGSGNYTAVMPAADATATDHAPIDWATVSTGADKDNAYMIYNKDQLDLLAHRVNGTHGETANGYSGKYFKLANDISYPHKADGEEGADTESNYEAIGGYYNGYRYFRGHFDGNNNTISGIRIYKGGDDAADYYQGIFGATDSGADIHDLTLADARITGYHCTGGIVGFNRDGTVTRCHVAADVAVCTVQSDAYDHGGIAGSNLGTIEQCNSAATLTTADADDSECYGGIAGYNIGTLHDNLAIGATVPAAKDNTYGAITGYNNGKVTLQRNYYTACKVADTENATGVGCGHIGNDDDGYITADVNNDNNPDGAVPALRDGADNSTALALMAAVPEKFGTYSVSLNGRTLSKSGEWNTLCLPFDVDDFSGTPLEGATVKELLTTSNLDSDGQLTLYFTAASSIKAGKPYIVKWEKPEGYDDADPETRDVKNPVFSGVTVSSTAPTAVNFTGGSFVGQYSPFSITADNIDEIILLSTGNRLGYSKSARTLRSFRCHFYVPAEGSEPGARAFVLNFDDETTEIISPAEIKEITDCNATLSKREMAGAWYSLDGRKLDAKPTKKGLYIHNGNKVVIK